MYEPDRHHDSPTDGQLSRTSLVNKSIKLKSFFDNMPDNSQVILLKANGYWLIKQRSSSCHTMSRSQLCSESIRPRKILDSVLEDEITNSVSHNIWHDFRNTESLICTCCRGVRDIQIHSQHCLDNIRPPPSNALLLTKNEDQAPCSKKETRNPIGQSKECTESRRRGMFGRKPNGEPFPDEKQNRKMAKEMNHLRARMGLLHIGIKGNFQAKTDPKLSRQRVEFLKINSKMTIEARNGMRIKVKPSHADQHLKPKGSRSDVERLVMTRREKVAATARRKEKTDKRTLPPITKAKRLF